MILEPLDLAAFELEALELGKDVLMPFEEWGALDQQESRQKVRTILNILGIKLDEQGKPLLDRVTIERCAEAALSAKRQSAFGGHDEGIDAAVAAIRALLREVPE